MELDAVMEGVIEADRLRWSEFVKIDGKYVRFWIWDVLALVLRSVPKGTRVRLSIEVLEDGGVDV